MAKFEINKRYYQDGLTYEIIKKTAKRITFKAIQHAGRFNERICKTKTVSLQMWESGDVFFDGDNTIEARFARIGE